MNPIDEHPISSLVGEYTFKAMNAFTPEKKAEIDRQYRLVLLKKVEAESDSPEKTKCLADLEKEWDSIDVIFSIRQKYFKRRY